MLTPSKYELDIRNYIRGMDEVVPLSLWAQYISYIKGVPAFDPQWVVCIDRKAWGRMNLFSNSLGANTNVGKCSALVHRPAIDMCPVVQLIEDFEPIVQVGVPPVWLDNSVP